MAKKFKTPCHAEKRHYSMVPKDRQISHQISTFWEYGQTDMKEDRISQFWANFEVCRPIFDRDMNFF